MCFISSICNRLALNVFSLAVYSFPGSFRIKCGVSSTGAVGPFFLEGSVTGAAYLNMLQESTFPAVRQLFGDEDMWCQ